MKLGQTILDIRKERKMTQEEFAQIFHVTRQTVSNGERKELSGFRNSDFYER